jgi:hypothetical protein
MAIVSVVVAPVAGTLMLAREWEASRASIGSIAVVAPFVAVI